MNNTLFSIILSAAVGFSTAYFAFQGKKSENQTQSMDFQNDFIEQLRNENKDLHERLDKLSRQMQEMQDENTQMRLQLAEIMAFLKQNNINYPQGEKK